MSSPDITFAVVVLGAVYMLFVHPMRVKERILADLLKTYREELRSGIAPENSQIDEAIKLLSEKTTGTKEGEK